MPESFAFEKLNLIVKSIVAIERRFAEIKYPDDFVKSENGEDMLDAILMRLMAIGENLKSIQAKDVKVLDSYPEIEWPNIMRFRDIVAHHYDALEYQIVFDICKNHLPALKIVIQKMIIELK